MKKLFFIVTILLTGLVSSSQTVIQMKRQGGVSIIPCKVNGLRLSFIFDTGASDVTISLTEALFMLKNGYLNSSDITGKKSYYSDANGDLSEGEIINLREIDIQGLKLYNVKASIVTNLSAPLLLGQTAISKLGIFQVDLTSNTLTIINKKVVNSSSNDLTNEFTSCIDIDGNVYQTIKIGNQIWMAENLKTNHYRNGDPISKVENRTVWGNLNSGAWSYYNNDFRNNDIYGKLYNWYAVGDSREIAPEGWRIPTRNDWIQLFNFLGGNDAGSKMKSNSTLWVSTNNISSYSSGFNAIPGGFRPWTGENEFAFLGERAFFWSSTQDETFTSANGISINFDSDKIYFYSFGKRDGWSIRCVKN